MKNLKHPATIIAMLALLVALGSGAAVAGGLISGASIKNHSIPANKLTAGAIASLSRMTFWNKSVATAAGTDPASGNSVVLAKDGPFTITGKCWNDGTSTDSSTFIQTSKDGAFAQGYSSNGSDSTPLNAADGAEQMNDDEAAGTTATNSPDFYGPNDGTWAATSADGKTVLNGTSNQAVWLKGASGPACSFSGFIVKTVGS